MAKGQGIMVTGCSKGNPDSRKKHFSDGDVGCPKTMENLPLRVFQNSNGYDHNQPDLTFKSALL